MYIIGKWCPRVDSGKGLEYFKSLYKTTYQEMIRKYRLDHITELTNKTISFLVFPEYDGDINQIFVLQDEDTVKVYSEGRLSDEGRIFNTDGMAFFTLIKEEKEIATWCVENSPYDLTDEDFDELDKPTLLNTIRKSLKANNLDFEVTNTNVLFVRQL
jgi:hypothetical protein